MKFIVYLFMASTKKNQAAMKQGFVRFCQVVSPYLSGCFSILLFTMTIVLITMSCRHFFLFVNTFLLILHVFNIAFIVISSIFLFELELFFFFKKL